VSTVYLDRENWIEWELRTDSSPIEANAVTRAVFWLPGSAAVSGEPVVFDTDTDTDITLTSGATRVRLKPGNRGLTPGRHTGFLTIYDTANPGGIAWTQVQIRVVEWQP